MMLSSPVISLLKCSSSLVNVPCHDQVSTMRRSAFDMALFGMVWLLRVRSEMKRCAKCRRECTKGKPIELQRTPASGSTFFTIDAPPTVASSPAVGPTTYCEVHGFNPPKEGKSDNFCHQKYFN